MVRQTEIETTEKEVEYVYCDECGDECTDEHRYKPSEVCISCSDDTAVRRVASLPNHLDHDDADLPIGAAIFFGVLFPFTAFVLFIMAPLDDDIETPSKDELKYSFMLMFGTALWTGAVVVAVMLM